MLKHFVTSVFDPWLWVTTRLRAWSVIVAMLLLLVPAFALDASSPWPLLRYVETKPKARAWYTLGPRIAKARARKSQLVLLLGGSTGREATAVDPYVSSQLTARCRRAVNFVNASTTTQRMASTWAIAAALPRDRLRLVIVTLNVNRFTEGYQDVAYGMTRMREPFPVPHRFEARLKALDPELVLPSRRALSQLGWFIRNLRYVDFESTLHAIASGPNLAPSNAVARDNPFDDRGFHRYRKPAKSFAMRRRNAQKMIAWRARPFEQKWRESLRLWKIFARELRRSGSTVVFVLLPRDPVMAITDPAFAGGMRTATSELKAAGYPVVDWQRLEGFERSDFFDMFHLLKTGRRKLHRHLLDLISHHLGACAARI